MFGSWGRVRSAMPNNGTSVKEIKATAVKV